MASEYSTRQNSFITFIKIRFLFFFITIIRKLVETGHFWSIEECFLQIYHPQFMKIQSFTLCQNSSHSLEDQAQSSECLRVIINPSLWTNTY